MTQETFSLIEDISPQGNEYLNHTLSMYASNVPVGKRADLFKELVILVRSERMKAAVITAEHWAKIGGSEV